MCLAPGNYGAFTRDSKQAPGVRVTPDARAGGRESNVVFGLVDLASKSWITFDRVTVGGVAITGISTHVTISNTRFAGFTTITGAQHASIVFDRDSFTWGARCGTTGPNALFLLDYAAPGFSGVTVANSRFGNSDCDGVHTGTALNVLDNTFYNLCDVGTNHTDNIQFQGAVGGVVAGNFIHEPLTGCTTQGITSYDGGTDGVVIENNVVDIGRPWGIEWYADKDSVIRHNTVVYRAPGSCEYGDACGDIDIDCKPAEFKCPEQAGYGTQVYDNIAKLILNNGAVVARGDHNYNGPAVRFAAVPHLPPSNGYGRLSDYRLAADSAGTSAGGGADLGIIDSK